MSKAGTRPGRFSVEKQEIIHIFFYKFILFFFGLYVTVGKFTIYEIHFESFVGMVIIGLKWEILFIASGLDALTGLLVCRKCEVFYCSFIKILNFTLLSDFFEVTVLASGT